MISDARQRRRKTGCPVPGVPRGLPRSGAQREFHAQTLGSGSNRARRSRSHSAAWRTHLSPRQWRCRMALGVYMAIPRSNPVLRPDLRRSAGGSQSAGYSRHRRSRAAGSIRTAGNADACPIPNSPRFCLPAPCLLSGLVVGAVGYRFIVKTVQAPPSPPAEPTSPEECRKHIVEEMRDEGQVGRPAGRRAADRFYDDHAADFDQRAPIRNASDSRAKRFMSRPGREDQRDPPRRSDAPL